MIKTYNKKAILSRLDKLEKIVPAERLINAFITKKGQQCILDCRLWDGVNGSGTRSVISEHQTFKEALNEFEQVQQRYPSEKDVLLFVDDLQEENIFVDNDLYEVVLEGISMDE